MRRRLVSSFDLGFDLLDIGEDLWSNLAALHLRVETVLVGHESDAGLTNIGGFEVHFQPTHGRNVGIFTCVHRAERSEVRQAQQRFVVRASTQPS